MRDWPDRYRQSGVPRSLPQLERVAATSPAVRTVQGGKASRRHVLVAGLAEPSSNLSRGTSRAATRTPRRRSPFPPRRLFGRFGGRDRPRYDSNFLIWHRCRLLDRLTRDVRLRGKPNAPIGDDPIRTATRTVRAVRRREDVAMPLWPSHSTAFARRFQIALALFYADPKPGIPRHPRHSARSAPTTSQPCWSPKAGSHGSNAIDRDRPGSSCRSSSRTSRARVCGAPNRSGGERVA
jgi:hypothetical protein